ncbi:MAG: GNAT family N-acetyltransferase [Leifsonia sp.]
MSEFLSPRAIEARHRVDDFTSGEESLDEWLRTRALKNETAGASRTFVSVDRVSGTVAGYYCLSASSLRSEDANAALRRNMPNPIPVLLIGRLAVDYRQVCQGLGASLLQDALLKSLQASRLVGARAILVQALSDSARMFYQKFGFSPIPHDERTMVLRIADAERTVRAEFGR